MYAQSSLEFPAGRSRTARQFGRNRLFPIDAGIGLWYTLRGSATDEAPPLAVTPWASTMDYTYLDIGIVKMLDECRQRLEAAALQALS